MDKNDKRLKNLKPFEKGRSGNPKGRPKKLPKLDDILGDVLGEENNDGITVAQGILSKLAAAALKGDTKAAQILLDRGYGKAVQPVEGTLNITNIRVGYKDEDDTEG